MKKHYNLTRTALLFALCIVLSVAESLLIPLSAASAPGIKVGLSNVPVMFALFCMGFPTALGLSVAKGVFALASRGVSAGLLSLTGGVLSTLIMYILKRVFKKKISLTLISVFGAIVHNAGQLLAASLLWRTLAVWSISPILIISGIVFGTVNALLVKLTLPYLSRLGEKK